MKKIIKSVVAKVKAPRVKPADEIADRVTRLDELAAANREARIKELEAALEREKIQHQTARENFAQAIAEIKARQDADSDITVKNRLIDEFIIELTKLLPSSDLVRRARSHRGIV